METKPTTSLRDRRISPSLARPSPKNLLPRGDISSPVEAKKPVVNYLKPKAVPSYESPTRRIPIIHSITASATTKTPSARRLADKAPSPSTFTSQRSLKPAKPSSSSMPNGHESAQTVSRTARTSLIPKAKSTSLKFVKKKEAPVTIAVIPEGKMSSDHDSVTAIERPVQEQLLNNHKKLVEALNEVENVEESDFISSLVDEGNHIEEQKSDEPENWVFDEVEEVPNKARVAVASTQVEKKDEEKVEHVDAVVRRVEPEVRRPIHGATVVMEMTTVKKKDASISNDVIEETKSKLMGTRKNKVLALVGAFETVISLQEPEGQQIQKTLHLQHGQQIQHDQQVEQSFENKKSQLGVDSQHNQEIQATQNAQQLGGVDEEHQGLEKEEENATLKEEGNEALERGEEREDEMLKKEADKGVGALMKRKRLLRPCIIME
ncbi:neurofilament medium polypeptide [Dendrobium catenatum]|uniref:Calmodulin-binding domain-containing protein n=1 Tax=Dendrobium catenatum TaxID=906689 RepID=A0A2I0W9D5_9ASPA|nr:neurofilament medium polypeptide [Dendrobium catenatum]PKU72270.1 hypothetical protein MA16_Dca006270 [Dendrobium catenatum]